MRELTLVRSATGWLRKLGIGLLALTTTLAVSLFALLGASSSSDGSASLVDNYISLNGSSQCAARESMSQLDVSADFAIEAWIYPTNVSAVESMIVNKEDSYEFAIRSGTFQYAIMGTVNTWDWRDTYIKATNNRWSHIALTKQGNTVTLYLDGNKTYQLTNSSFANTNIRTSNRAFNVGCRAQTAGSSMNSYFAGRMDEVRLWNSSRSQAEIARDMHRNNIGPVGNLVGYWDFNEPSGSTVYDRSGFGGSLTLYGSPARADVKNIRYESGGETVVVFTRTYLPGVAGWVLPTQSSRVRALVVAGGGGGGGDEGGGGGGGGAVLIEGAAFNTGSPLTVRVGQGGFGANNVAATARSVASATNGQDSVLSTVVSLGGGAGGDARNGDASARSGADGGSGGGRAGEESSGTAGLGTPGQGNNGAATSVTVGNGGGGAGEAASGKNGGQGTASSIIPTASAVALNVGHVSSNLVYFSGGGGGGQGNSSGGAGTGGLGGGSSGNGSSSTPDALPNTGGGGGGGGADFSQGSWNAPYSGKSGAAGVVIIVYAPSKDFAWNKSSTTEGNFAFRNSSSDPVIPISPSAAWTFETWVYPTALSQQWTPLFAQQVDSDTFSNRNAIWINYSQLVLVSPSGDTYTGINIPTGRWVHVAWTLSTGQASVLYVDGSKVWAGNLVSRTGNAGTHFAVGGSRQNEWGEFPGHVDQVKIWGTQLSAAQVAASMNSHSTWSGAPADSCSTGLRALYDFNEFTDGQVIDRSGCGRHLEFNISVSGNYAATDLSEARIIETGTAHTEQTYVKFMRSYLTANGGWTPPSGIAKYKALVVAGGGGGGFDMGGGGGGGAVISGAAEFTSGAYSVTVGAGGFGNGAGIGTNGSAHQFAAGSTNGGDSIFANALQTSVFKAKGGGAGGSSYWAYTPGGAGLAGGSGGGSSGYSSGGYLDGGVSNQASAGTVSGVTYASVYGNRGGRGGGQYYSGGGGGAGGIGTDSTARSDGGPGIANAILGTNFVWGGGGGGSGYSITGGNGGSGGGGGGAYGTTTGGSGINNGSAGGVAQTNTQGGNGGVNTGGGGGGGAHYNVTNKGGNGGSGIVVLSWGPYLEVTQTTNFARATQAFGRSIKLEVKDELTGTKMSTASPITVTASANVLTLNGILLTQSYTVNSVDGVVDFTGLGFSSNVTGPVTLTFTSDSFVGTSLVVNPTYFPSNVEIRTSGTTAGTFFEGSFYATTSSGTTVINATDLTNHLASYSTVISASGFINVVNSFTSTSTSTLVLKAGSYINVTAGQQVRTYGGDLVLWADSDQTSGGYVRLLNASTLCTTAGTCGATSTGGGDIVIGGGAADSSNPLRPAGSAVGSGSTYNTTGTADTTGVQIGTIGVAGSGAKIYSAGGDIQVRGRVTPSNMTDWRAGIAVVGGAIVNSGEGKILLSADVTGAGNYTGSIGTIEFGAWGGAVEINSKSTASDSVVIEGLESSTSSTYGLWATNDTNNVISAGGFIMRANHIYTSIDLHLSVSGQVVIEPHSTSLRSSTTLTAAFESRLTNTDTDNYMWLKAPPASIRVGSASNSNEVEMPASVTSQGDIEVYADDIDITTNAQITTTNSDAKILLKAKDWIDIRNGTNASTHAKLQTNNGDIILWSDADGSGAGSTYLGTYVELNSANGEQSKTGSGGGRITIAGSFGDSGVDADGHPLGALSDTGQVNGSASQTYAYFANDYHEIYSGGGKVVIRATSNAAQGAGFVNNSSKLWSGTGKIEVSFSHIASDMGVRIESAQWISAATTTPAIEISTTTAGNYEGFYGGNAAIMHLASTATTGGGISISAISPSATNQNIEMWGWDILSKNGPISITTNGYANWNDDDARNFGAKTGSDVTSSNADINIVVNGMYDNVANTSAKISTSGAVSFKPTGANYALDYSIRFDIQAGSFEFGKIENISSATNNLTFLGDVTSELPITASARTITFTSPADLVTTGQSSRVLLKAKTDIISSNGSGTTDGTHSRVQTNNGDIVFWTDADGDGTGGIYLGNYFQFNSANGVENTGAATSGGDILLGGGLATDSRGYPTGYAATSAHSTDRAIHIQELVRIFSGGGDVIMRGRSNSTYGILFYRDFELYSGVGKVEVDAITTSTGNAYGFTFVDTGFVGQSAGPLTIVSAATSSPAISLNGNTSGVWYGIRLLGTASTNNITIASTATTGGGIEIEGRAAAGSDYDITVNRANILSRNGAITFSASLNNLGIDQGTAYDNYFGSNAAGTLVTTSSADIFMEGDQIDFDATATRLNTSGDVTIVPKNANYFAQNQTFAFSTNGVRNLTVGKTPLAGDTLRTINLSGTHTTSGNVKIHGGNIEIPVTSRISITGAGSSILLKASGWVDVANGTSTTARPLLQTNNGDIILWSDADNSGAGKIYVGSYATLNSANGQTSDGLSGGGRITLAGSSGDISVDADGHPMGSANDDGDGTYTLVLQGNSNLISGGGKVTIRGYSNSNTDTFHNNGSSLINSGTGQIAISVSHATRAGYKNQGGTLKSASTQSPAIEIYSKNSGTGEYGLWFAGTPRFISTGDVAVGISMSGLIGAATSAGITADTAFDMISRYGDINLTTDGILTFSSTNARNIGAKASSEVVISAADVQFKAANVLDGTSNTSAFISTSGAVKIVPFSTNFNNTSTWNFTTVAGSFEFGSSNALATATKAITLYKSTEVTGAITISENAIYQESGATLNSTADSGAISLQSNAATSLKTTVTSVGTVLVRSGSLAFASATITGSAAVTFESQSTAYTTAPTDFSSLTLATSLRSLSIGKESETGTITLNKSYTISGPVSVNGGTINVRSAFRTTSTSAKIQFKSSGDIFVSSSGDVTSAGGPIVLWSNADNDTSVGGRILVEDGAVFTSNGGDVVMGGGSSTDANGYPSGYAKPQNSLANGIGLGFSGDIISTTGDVIMRASIGGGSGNVDSKGLVIGSDGLIESTTGDISLVSIYPSGDSSSGGKWPAWIGGPIRSSTGSITINADTSNYTGISNTVGGLVFYPSVAITSDTGDISISAKSSTVNGLDIDPWTSGGGVDVSTSGSVTIAGRSGNQINLAYSDIRAGGTLTILTDGFKDDSTTMADRGDIRAANIVIDRASPSSTNATLDPINVYISQLSGNVTIGSSAVLNTVSRLEVSVSGTITLRGKTVKPYATLRTSGANQGIYIYADTIDANNYSQTYNAVNNGRVVISQNTNGRNILLNATTTSQTLALASTTLAAVRATTLQVGDTNSGQIFIGANLTISSSNVEHFRISTPGSVSSLNGANLTAPNLAIDAGGGVSLPGSNSVAGNVAISASSMVTYSSAVSYSPAVVDGVTPVFGVGTAISLTNSPSIEQANEFLAVTFNPPPQVLVTDAYSKVLDGNNRLAYQYTASATVTSGSGTVTGLTSSSRVGGNITFNAIRVMTVTGVYKFDLSVQTPTATFTVASANYNVMAGEPARLVVTASDTVSVVAQAGFGFAVAVEDISGNRITIGENKNITVSASVSGTTATILSGNQVRANDDGVATFSNLVISGSVSDTISVSFLVTYQRLSDNQTVTVTSSAVALTLTHGDAAQISLTNSATARSGIAFTSQPVVHILDAYGNLVTTGASASQTVVLSATSATLSGTASISASAGIATFSGIALEGQIGNKTLTATITSPATSTATSTINLSFGNVSQLSLEQAASGAANRVAFATQPKVALRDSAGNLVTGVATSIQLATDPSTTVSNATAAVSTSNGIATFANTSITGLIGSYTLSYTVTGASASSIASVSQTLTLTHGAATNLAYIQQPTGARAGITVSEAVVIKVIDLEGNLVSTGNFSSGSATLYISEGQSLNLAGTTRTSFSAGIATFSNFAILGTAQVNVRLQVNATDPVVNHFPSTARFPLTAGLPSKLGVIAGQPASVSAGVTQSSNISVQLQDAWGNQTSQSSPVSIAATAVDPLNTSVVQMFIGNFTISAMVTTVSIAKENFTLTASGDYQFRFSSADVSSALSRTITVKNAAAAKLVLTQDVPSTISSGLTFNPVLRLQVQDIYDNPVLDSVTTVSATLNSGTLQSLSGTTASNALGSSYIDFTNLALSGAAGQKQLRLTAANSGTPVNGTSITTSVFSLANGAAYALSASATVVTVANRTTLSDVAIYVVDASGNVIPDSTAQITASVLGITLSGTATMFANSGQVTFSGLALSGAAGSYNLGFSANGLVSATISLTVKHGNASYLTLTTSATAKNAEALASQPVVKIFDVDGNLVTTGAQSTQTVELIVSPGTLTGTSAISASGGIATFSGIALSGTVGSHTLTGRIYIPTTLSDNETITLGFGNATKLTLETQGAGAASGIALTTQPVLKLRDSSNNEVTGVAHNVVATIDPAASLSGTTVAVNTSTATATFTALSISGTVGSYTISFSIEGASSSDVASVGQAIELTHGVATNLRVVSQPSSGVAGVTLSALVVEVIDARGNRVTSGDTSSTTVRITNAKPYTVVSGTKAVSLSSGVATFDNVSLDLADVQYLRLEVSGIPGINTSNFSVTGGAPYKLGFTGNPPANRKAGETQAGDAYVRVYDRFNNFATLTNDISVAVTVVLSSDTNSVSKTISSNLVVTPSNGFATVTRSTQTMTKSGSYQFKASATNLETGFSSAFVISNAAASKLVMVQNVPSSIRSGLSFSPSVLLQVQDPFNNPVLDSVTTISTTIVSGSATAITGATASNALGDSYIELPDLAVEGTAGTKRLRFSATSNSAGLTLTHIESQNFALTFGEPVRLSASATAISVANRTTITDILLSVLDSAGNTVTDNTAQIQATVSGIALSGTSTRFASSGQVNFSGLALSGTIGTYNLGFTSTGLTGATVSVTVTHGAADYLTIDKPATAKNHISLGSNAVVVRIFDADNNLVTSGAQSTQTVQLSSLGAVSSGTNAVSASGGIATFSNVVLTGLVGTKTLSATIQLPSQISTSSAIELEPGNPYRLELTQAANGFSNREVFGTAPIVTVEDVSGNTVPTAGMDIRVKVSTASISGSITASAQTGVATFASNLVLRGTAGSHTLIYEAEGMSSSGVISTSQVITLNHGAASQLVVTTAIANALSGVDFGTQPRVELRDPEGNRVSTSNQATATVEVSYSGAVWDAQSKQGVTLTGTRAISLSAGIGQFSGLRLSGVAGSYSLEFSFIDQPAISISSAVTLEPGNATGIKVVQGPQDVIAGERFAQSVSAEIIDDYDNRVTRVTSSATLVANLKSATNSALISTSPEFTAQNGLVIFNGLTFESAGSRFIQFASGAASSLPNLSPITSTTFVITHAAPSALEWVTQPATSVANDAEIVGQGASYPELRALDRFGNLVDTGTVSYTAEVTSTPAPQAFTGISTDGVLGVGTFQNLKLKATVGNYTIRFKANTDTNANYFASISHSIEVLHGVPTQVVATTHPTAVRAGVNFATQPVIEVRDSAGNRVSSSNAVVTITATGADLTGQTQATAVNGIATFTTAQLSGSISGAVSLNYAITYQSQTISTSESVNLTPGLADYMVLDWTAADIQTRAAISPAPVVRLYDEFGNLVTLDNATQVTAKLFRLGSLVTTSAQVFSASAGVIDFTGLTFIAEPNQGFSLQFESTGLTAVSSSAVTVLPGPVERVEIVDEPGTGAGVTQTRTGNALSDQPRIKLVDFDGNIVTTINSGSITAAIASGIDGQVISASVSVSAGIGQFTELGLVGKVATPTQSAEIYRLEFSYNGITSSPSAQLTLKHNVAHKIVQIQDASGGQAGLPFQVQPKVKIVDKFGNTVFQDSARTIVVVPQVMSGAGSAETAVSSQATTQADGTATFNTGIGGSVNNTYRLIFRTPQQDLIEASQSNVVITHGEANNLAITREASASVSNTVRTMTGQALAVQPVIEIRDRYGNRVLSANEEITATLSSTIRGARDYLKNFTVSAVAGVATFSNLMMVVKPEQEYQLAFSFYASVNAYTQTSPIWVTHALAEYITIERQPQGGNKTGNSLSLSPVVTVRDFDGNPTTMITGQTVSANISQGSGSITANGEASLIGGIATFSNLTIVALPGENQRLRFTLDGNFQNSVSQAVTSVASNEISVTFNDPHKLALIQQPSANAVTAELLAVQPKVVIQDFYGNTVSSYVGSVSVQSQNGSRLVGASDETISSLSALVVNGVAEFSSIRIEGPANSGYTLDFNSGALQSTTSNPVVLTHTTAHSLEIVTQPTGAVTGTLLATQPSVRILDRFGNVLDTNNSAQVSVTVASGPNRPGGAAAQISGSTTVTVASGIATFSGLKFTGLVNSDYVFRFATSGITVDSNPVRVTSAGADSFEWVQLPVASRTGDLMPTPAVLRVLDFDGNLAVSSSDTVTVTVTGGGYIESGTTSQIVDGYVTFSNLVLVATPGVPQQLTFTATTAQGSFATSTTQSLTVTHTDASELRVNQSPNQVGQQGAAFTTQPKIFLYDRYGNKAIYDNSTVVTATIASGNGGAVSGSSVVTAVAGEANFASLALTGSPGVAYTLKYSVGNSYHVVDSTVLRVFKTAAINVAYPSPNFSLSATVAPTVAYTDSTENPLVFTSTTTQFCTVNSSTGVATIVAAGTCVIRVSVADGTYYKQNVLDVNLVIQKAAQTPLVMTSPNFVDYGQVLTLTHSGGSSTATPQYFASGTCRAFGNQLMMFGDATEDSTASCTVLVTRGGDQNFVQATSEPQEIVVRKIAQAPLSIGNARQTSVGDVDLFTVGGSGPGTVSYQVSAGVGTATCSIVDGNKLRATTNGWCEVSAQKNASVNYNTASSPVVVFTFSKQVQVVTFTSATPGMLLPGQSYQLAASASSGLTVSFAVTRGLEVQASAQTSYSPAICSLTQNTVTLLGTGTCEITATQAGNSQFASATAKLVLTVGQLNQVITFPQPEDLVYGTPTARLTAQASSGLPVRYTISAGVTACTVSTDGLLTLTSAGDCSVTANQPGDGRYAAAAPVTRIFTVTPDQASSPALVSAAVGNQWFTVGYTQPSYTGGSNIIGYRLEVTDLGTGDRYVNSACSTTAPLSCTMVGIPNSRTYSARVAAITAAGVGRYSSATAALVPTNAEISVTQLKAGISGADLVMQWTPPAAVAGTFLRYDIYVWPQGSTPPASPTTTVSTLSATSTAVPVATMTSSGNITQSSNVSQPVFVNAFQVRSRVLVFGAINQGPVGFIRLASSQSQVATASNLIGYEMRVVTVTDQYASAQTINTAMGVKLGLSTPDAPTQLTLDTTDPTKIIASWGAPNFDGGFPIEDYEVRSNGQVICANIQVRMCEISPLTQSTLYRIEVRARSGAGLGAAASAQHTTPTPPAVTLNSGTELLVRLPAMQNFIPKLARPGQIVEVGGTKLNAINELRLGGVKIDFTAVSATELRFRVPLDTKPGTYNIEHYSEFGKVTVIDALTVVLAPATESPMTESPVTESPVTESPEPGDTDSPEVPGDSGSGSSGSGGSGSNGSGSTGGSSGGSSSGGNSPGGSDSGASESPDSEVDNGGSSPEPTDSEIALPDAEERQPISLLWILLLALVIAGASYWLLARRQSERS